MILRQIQGTDGAATAAVKANDRSVFNVIVGETCHSGIRFGSDGVASLIQANGGFSAISSEWLISGSAAGFWVQRTIISGTLEVDPGAGFLQLNTTRTYDNQKASVGSKTTSLFFEFSSDSSGTPVVATATMNFTSERDVS